MILILLVIDQLVKFLTVHYKPSIDVFGDFLRLEYVENTGTIFGLFTGNNFTFIIISFVVCIILGIFIGKFVSKKSFKEKCYTLVLAGGIGNLIDRVIRGFVVDYVSMKWVGIFNLSDVYIIVGVILVIIVECRELFTDDDKKK